MATTTTGAGALSEVKTVRGPLTTAVRVCPSSDWQCGSQCAACQVTFSMFLYPRRHHCRLCGKSFCYQHAKEFAPLPDSHGISVRLCDSCHGIVTLAPEPTHTLATTYGASSTQVDTKEQSTMPPTNPELPASKVLPQTVPPQLRPAMIPATTTTELLSVRAAPTVVPVLHVVPPFIPETCFSGSTAAIQAKNGQTTVGPISVRAVRPLTVVGDVGLSSARPREVVDPILSRPGTPLPARPSTALYMGETRETDTYVVEVRLGAGTCVVPGEEWIAVPTNLNPGGRQTFLSYRISSEEKLAIRDIRVLVLGKGEKTLDRLPRGYEVVGYDLNIGVANAPPTFLCLSRSAQSGKPIKAIQAVVVDKLPFTMPRDFVRVAGDYGGNVNAHSKTHIYLAVSHSLPTL